MMCSGWKWESLLDHPEGPAQSQSSVSAGGEHFIKQQNYILNPQITGWRVVSNSNRKHQSFHHRRLILLREKGHFTELVDSSDFLETGADQSAPRACVGRVCYRWVRSASTLLLFAAIIIVILIVVIRAVIVQRSPSTLLLSLLLFLWSSEQSLSLCLHRHHWVITGSLCWQSLLERGAQRLIGQQRTKNPSNIVRSTNNTNKQSKQTNKQKYQK